MQKGTSSVSSLASNKFNEQILVVKRDDIFSLRPAWNGFIEAEFEPYISLINEKKQFLSRGLMEDDPSYKQIIPYLIFEHDGNYFLMRRSKKSSEERLAHKYSLGIGGHIRQEDLGEDSIFDWARREFHEEVNYTGDLTVKPLGIINDDTNPVGQVHIGFVMLLQGSSSNISIKSELEHGQLVSLEHCNDLSDSLEKWSLFVVDYLNNKK